MSDSFDVPPHTHNGVDSPFTIDHGGTSTSTSGGVSSVSITTANGIVGSVLNPTTTPAITLQLDVISPNAVNAIGNVTGANLSGTNTGDQSFTDASMAFTDITTNDASNSKHGFMPKSPNDATKYLNGASVPSYENVTDAQLSVSDVVTNNVSTSKHGFAPKGDGSTTKFLNANGAYSAATVLRTHGQTMTRLGNAASGNQTIAHGLGIPPTLARFTVYYVSITGLVSSTGGSTGNGADDNTHFYYNASVLTAATSNSSNACIHLEWGSGAQTSQIASATFDATNITLAWTLSGSGTNTNPIAIYWECEG